MKKSLVLSLVLVLALAANAMAAVNLGGWYQLEIDNDKFNAYDWTFQHKYELNFDAKAGEGKDGGWQFDARVGRFKHDSTEFDDINFQDYRLQLWKGEVKVDVSNRNLGWVNTPLNLVRMHEDQDDRVRVTFPVADLAKVEAEYEFGKRFISFVRGDVADNANVGLSLEHDFQSSENESGKNETSVGAFGTFKVADVTLNANTSYSILDGDYVKANDIDNIDLLALAVKAETKLTDELKVDALYRQIGKDWAVTFADGTRGARHVSGNLTYDIPNIQVKAGVSADRKLNNSSANEQDKVYANVSYYTSTNLPNWNDDGVINKLNTWVDSRHEQFNGDRWIKRAQDVDGFATQVQVEQIMPKAADKDNETILRGRVASQLIEDLAWGVGSAKYNVTTGNTDLMAGISVKASEDLTIAPKTQYTIEKKDAKGVLNAGIQAQYYFGSQWVGLNLGRKDITDVTADGTSDFAQITVRIGF